MPLPDARRIFLMCLNTFEKFTFEKSKLRNLTISVWVKIYPRWNQTRDNLLIIKELSVVPFLERHGSKIAH